MGLKIRKSIKLTDNIKINANKSGPSISFGGLSLGGKKAKVTVSKKKVTASLPGTGISYDAKLPTGKKKTGNKKG